MHHGTAQKARCRVERLLAGYGLYRWEKMDLRAALFDNFNVTPSLAQRVSRTQLDPRSTTHVDPLRNVFATPEARASRGHFQRPTFLFSLRAGDEGRCLHSTPTLKAIAKVHKKFKR
jgi:hypothetical protein